MKTLLLILAIVFVIMGAWTKHRYKTEVCLAHGGRIGEAAKRKIPWFIGSVFSFATEGICWWYIITQLFVK